MRSSLRGRIFAACFAMGAGFAVFFGAMSLVLLELMEFEQVDLILSDELNSFMEAHARDATAPAPRTAFLDAWVAPRAALESLPPEVRNLRPGFSEVNDGEHERRVAVAERNGIRYAVSIDLTLLEPWEQRVSVVVIALVTLCTVLAALLGRWLSDRVVSPVARLAARVASAPPDAAGASPGAFSAGFGDDEVGRLAHALDAYAGLLVAHARRERDFSGQASHELRTPVAIAATSLELALADEALSERSRGQLARAGRAVEWMRETLEALMALARAQSGAEGCTELAVIVREQVVEAEALLEGKPVRLQCKLAEGIQLPVLPGAARTVARNLLANACAGTASGAIEVALDHEALLVSDTGTGIRPGEEARLFEPFTRGAGAHAAGEGLGLAIVRRICELYGWQVTLERNLAGGTDARVRFDPTAVEPGKSSAAMRRRPGHGTGAARVER